MTNKKYNKHTSGLLIWVQCLLLVLVSCLVLGKVPNKTKTVVVFFLSNKYFPP